MPIDSSKPYRWPSELVALVEAVVRTDPNNESTWVEWKSVLDLNDKSGHQHIAKHVLGFANRTVKTAAMHAGGHAYLVVGAEPGNLAGIVPVDHATLRPRIARYVGPAVRWRAEYVTVLGSEVLVVVVEPPEHGDPIHPVRSQLDVHPKGRILVRRPGSTDPADDHEIDQLVARVRSRSDRLSITIEPVRAVIEALPDLPDFHALAEAERAATLARPRAGSARLSPLHPLNNYLASFQAAMMRPDERTEEDYEREVGNYIEAYKQALLDRYLWRLWHHQPARLALSVHNLTEMNFTDVDPTVHVSGEVRSWPDEWDVPLGEEPGLPKRPPPLGTPTPRYNFRASPSVPFVNPASYQFDPGGPGYSIEDTGSVDIHFDDLHLRPEDRILLPAVPLLVKAPAGEVLACEWTATAGNVAGRLTGEFTITVEPSTLSLDGLDLDDENADPDES